MAKNAAFIAAPRVITESLDLEGRVFLHSYDWRHDTEGQSLEVIMTAPLIVAEWINMQYFFSSIDNKRYGSGTKVLHNIVGQFGTMLGNASDLQIGLPLQSVMLIDGELYHEPIRLMTILVSPLEWVETIIHRHSMLNNLFENEWISLVVFDPQKKCFYRHQAGEQWLLLQSQVPSFSCK